MDIKNILTKYPPSREYLLEVLHEIQEADPQNHVSTEAMTEVAAWMKIPLSAVYGVLKYYSMYSSAPRGKHIVRVCNSVVCAMKGGEGIKSALENRYPANTGTYPSGSFSVEFTECLGHCEQAPAMMIDAGVLGNLDPESAIAALNSLNDNTL
ncbi:MAG TPA: NAD(P)H-dependent oxidoreductase subunit E [Bacteroidales bacterium]|nr:NAD(P)H-dependent oxidoreductase subunit E [Bacteroidales bacterium]HRZ48153.1 NAD(P)H-dependent oxidoreductase subunit E [Bacteroidales bacterium]